MTQEEQKEQNEILNALDAIEFRTVEFLQWIESMNYQAEDISKGWFYYVTKHGTLAYTFRMLGGVSRVTFCSYVPQSTNEAIHLVAVGKSASGKSLAEADIKEIESDYSLEAVPERVLFTCAMAAGWAPGDVTATSNIVEDLLDGDDDEYEKEYLLSQIFDELEVWFQFKRPDLEERLGTFRTVQDIITYVKNHFEKV